MDSQNIRWKERFSVYGKALMRLKKGIATLQADPANELMQAGLIQMYEFTFELAWKVMKDYLNYEGYEVKSPRNALRQAFQVDLIKEADLWFDALENRNAYERINKDGQLYDLVNKISNSYLNLFQELYSTLLKKQKLQLFP